MKSIYLAGPYTGNEEENTEKMVAIYRQLIKKGYFPFCPLLSHYASDGSISYTEWLRQDVHWMLKCDALLFLGSSKGADIERLVAEARGIPVYESIEELHK